MLNFSDPKALLEQLVNDSSFKQNKSLSNALVSILQSLLLITSRPEASGTLTHWKAVERFMRPLIETEVMDNGYDVTQFASFVHDFINSMKTLIVSNESDSSAQVVRELSLIYGYANMPLPPPVPVVEDRKDASDIQQRLAQSQQQISALHEQLEGAKRDAEVKSLRVHESHEVEMQELKQLLIQHQSRETELQTLLEKYQVFLNKQTFYI
jgi:hypothetical protein